MSKLVFYKQSLRDTFSRKYALSKVSTEAGRLLIEKPRTTLGTFWEMYLSAYVNELAMDKDLDDDVRTLDSGSNIPYRAYFFNGLTLTFSTVGELPAEVNYYYQTMKCPLLETAKCVFASYMVLLAMNQREISLKASIKSSKKEVVIKSFQALRTYLSETESESPLPGLFDICMNAVRVNENQMLSFDLEEVVDAFQQHFGVNLRNCGLKNVEFSSQIDGTDIYQLLRKSTKLYPEDLLFFETELETSGKYDYIYVKKCKDLIEKKRKANKARQKRIAREPEGHKSSVFMSLSDLSPLAPQPSVKDNDRQWFFSGVKATRNTLSKSFDQEFKRLIKSSPFLSAEFIRENVSFFEPRELNILLTFFDMGEDFLEQYFSSLDPVLIACHQHFSEAFFMKHFRELNYNNVLKKGVNDWRFKENRSKQLDVFLRLKGVQI